MVKRGIVVAVLALVGSALAANYGPASLRPLWFAVALVAVGVELLLALRLVLPPRRPPRGYGEEGLPEVW